MGAGEWLVRQQLLPEQPVSRPHRAMRGTQRVLRGGSWNVGPSVIRVSSRFSFDPGFRHVSIGFRCGGELKAEGIANGANDQPSESEASVRAALDAWVQAFRSKDLTALAESYAPQVEKYFRRTNISREEIR